MKKLFSVLAIAALAAACNNEGKKDEAKTDTTAVTPAPATQDTTAKADSASMPKPDSAAAAK